MITREILVANSALAGLTEDQINAIITINNNDVAGEIGKKTSEIYQKFDQLTKDATGVDRLMGATPEKTYDYLPRAIQEMKKSLGDNEALKTQIQNLTAEKTRLEGELAKGAGAEVQRQLDQTKAELANTKSQYNTLQSQMAEKEKAHQAEIFGIRVDNDLNVASKGMQFKSEIPVSVQTILLQNAYTKIKGMNPDYIDDGNGGKRLVFRGQDGAVLNNPENQLNPYTAGELLERELKDVLAAKREVLGGGTKPLGGGHGAGDPTVDVSGAKSQNEAQEILTKQFLAQGMTIGSDQFQEAMDKAWKDNNIINLPIR